MSTLKAPVTETGCNSQFKGKKDLPLCPGHRSSGDSGVSKKEVLAFCLLAPMCCQLFNNILQKERFVLRREGETPQAAATSPLLLMGDAKGEVMLLQPGAFLGPRLVVASNVITREAMFHPPNACIHAKALECPGGIRKDRVGEVCGILSVSTDHPSTCNITSLSHCDPYPPRSVSAETRCLIQTLWLCHVSLLPLREPRLRQERFGNPALAVIVDFLEHLSLKEVQMGNLQMRSLWGNI